MKYLLAVVFALTSVSLALAEEPRTDQESRATATRPNEAREPSDVQALDVDRASRRQMHARPIEESGDPFPTLAHPPLQRRAQHR